MSDKCIYVFFFATTEFLLREGMIGGSYYGSTKHYFQHLFGTTHCMYVMLENDSYCFLGNVK